MTPKPDPDAPLFDTPDQRVSAYPQQTEGEELEAEWKRAWKMRLDELKSLQADKDRLQRERDEKEEGRERARHYEVKRLGEAVEAKARADRLQRENERLRETLRGFRPAWESKRLMPAGPCKLIKIALTDAETGTWARAEVAARQVLESKSCPNDSGTQQ